MVTITAQDNGGIKLVDEYVNADGKTSHAEFTAKFDVKPYSLIVDPRQSIRLRLIELTQPLGAKVLKKAGNEIESGRNGTQEWQDNDSHLLKERTHKDRNSTTQSFGTSSNRALHPITSKFRGEKEM